MTFPDVYKLTYNLDILHRINYISVQFFFNDAVRFCYKNFSITTFDYKGLCNFINEKNMIYNENGNPIIFRYRSNNVLSKMNKKYYVQWI